jgi:4-amino-4-deoxy-L-arabinose transferase-like glycosyltransferase
VAVPMAGRSKHVPDWLLMASIALIMMAAAAWRLHGAWWPSIGNDGYQYLSVASNAKAGHIGYTSLVHFDAERRFGTIPAPMVTFPSGFPLLVAAVGELGLDLRQAALSLNLLAELGVVLCLFWAGRRLQWSDWACCLLSGCYALNTAALSAATAVMTEPVSTLLITAGVCLLLVDADEMARRGSTTGLPWRRVIGAGLLIGLAYYVRYAALFILVGLFAATAWAWWRQGWRVSARLAVSAMVAGTLMGLGLLRNTLLVGNWRGGNEKHVFNPIAGVLTESLRAVDELALGLRGTGAPTWLHATFFAVLLVGAAAWLWHVVAARAPALPTTSKRSAAAVELAVIIAGVYAACMFYAGVFSVISYGARMFLPILPVLYWIVAHLMCSAWLAPGSIGRRPMAVWMGGLIALHLAAQGLALATPLSRAKNMAYEQMALSDVSHGETASTVIHQLIGPNQAMLSNTGQALGQVLQVPTVSMVSTEYSNRPWDEALVREVIQRFHITAIVVKRPAPDEADNLDVVPSPMVKAWANLQHPDWMTPRWTSERLIVYAVTGSP